VFWLRGKHQQIDYFLGRGPPNAKKRSEISAKLWDFVFVKLQDHCVAHAVSYQSVWQSKISKQDPNLYLLPEMIPPTVYIVAEIG